MEKDTLVRIEAFNWLAKQVNIHGDVLPRILLQQGFSFQGYRIPLVAPQGIFKPKILDLPLSITTAPKGPYDDSFDQNNLLIYKYRGSDPRHRDNVGLRKVFQQQKPLVYLHGVVPGKYLAVWPIYIIDDNPEKLEFKAVLEELVAYSVKNDLAQEVSEAKRAYLTSTVKVRLHQRNFREKVLDAYQSQCTLCRLKHRELLDAAHIIPDNLPEGKPIISNGLSLCKLHHAAFDKLLLGITPDYTIHIRDDILLEEDGPVLQHGIIDLHKTKIVLPSSRKNWPNQEALEWRYKNFKEFA